MNAAEHHPSESLPPGESLSWMAQEMDEELSAFLARQVGGTALASEVELQAPSPVADLAGSAQPAMDELDQGHQSALPTWQTGLPPEDRAPTTYQGRWRQHEIGPLNDGTILEEAQGMQTAHPTGYDAQFLDSAGLTFSGGDSAARREAAAGYGGPINARLQGEEPATNDSEALTDRTQEDDGRRGTPSSTGASNPIPEAALNDTLDPDAQAELDAFMRELYSERSLSAADQKLMSGFRTREGREVSLHAKALTDTALAEQRANEQYALRAAQQDALRRLEATRLAYEDQQKRDRAEQAKMQRAPAPTRTKKNDKSQSRPKTTRRGTHLTVIDGAGPQARSTQPDADHNSDRLPTAA